MAIMNIKKTANTKVDKVKEGLTNPRSQSPLNLVIDAELHKQFKIKTTMEGVSMTDVIVEFMTNYLDRK